ncbi:MAG: bifunctional diguanylate cyclase/phosphodiesterase [Sporolactobacillus sp.]
MKNRTVELEQGSHDSEILLNRLQFRRFTEQAIANAKQAAGLFAIVFLDVDGFFNINDTLGHASGDVLMLEAGLRMAESIGPGNRVTRFGGDEFLLFLQSVPGTGVVEGMLDDLITTFQRPFMLAKQEVNITFSAGVAFYPQDGDNFAALLKNADIAMHEAKHNGRNQFAICSSNMKAKLCDRMALINGLFHVLARQELRLYFQPQVSVQSGKICSAEVLLRWVDPVRGFIPPAAFIPLAEQTGCIHVIGEWVLRQSCLQMKAWQDAGMPIERVAVNLSGVQLRHPKFLERVQRALEETELDPHMLELEVTESALGNNYSYTIDLLNELKRFGISLSIDDYGKAYSSLSRLKELPVDRLKMDISFVRDIHRSKKGTIIAREIIRLAEQLEMSSVAEGVESKEQLLFLREAGCDLIQGYFFYQPMTAEALEDVLKRE